MIDLVDISQALLAYDNLLFPCNSRDNLEPISHKLPQSAKQIRHPVCLFQSAKAGVIPLRLHGAELAQECIVVLLEGVNAKLTRRYCVPKAPLICLKIRDALQVFWFGVKRPLSLGDGVEKPRYAFISHGFYSVRVAFISSYVSVAELELIVAFR